MFRSPFAKQGRKWVEHWILSILGRPVRLHRKWVWNTPCPVHSNDPIDTIVFPKKKDTSVTISSHILVVLCEISSPRSWSLKSNSCVTHKKKISKYSTLEVSPSSNHRLSSRYRMIYAINRCLNIPHHTLSIMKIESTLEYKVTFIKQEYMEWKSQKNGLQLSSATTSLTD